MDEWPKVTRCSVVESLVSQHGPLVLAALWDSQLEEADERYKNNIFKF